MDLMQRKYRLVCGSRKRCRSHDASVLEGHMLSIAKYWRKVVATSLITCSTREPLYHPFYRLLSTKLPLPTQRLTISGVLEPGR